ncbi:hypothetical protein Q5H89_05310 [Hymenobacter sp. CA2-7]|nr:hypothetical protein [Hymenobacter sp. CA2-7]
MNAINHQWMKHGTAKQAVLRKDRPAAAAVFYSSCDSVFVFFASLFWLPPHSLEAVFLCPAGAPSIVRASSACPNADRVSHYNVL